MTYLSKKSRRTFIKTGLGAGLCAATAPMIMPRLMAQGSANEQLGVACIGVGGRGSGIGSQAVELGRLVACCDVHQKNANNFAGRQKEKGRQCKIYTDYRELLEKENGVDVVTIGTPDHWHVKIAIEAMKAGKHVYCEKPLTLTIDEGRVVKEAAAKYGKIFQVGTQQRSEFGHRFLKAVAIARSGRLGKNLEAISSVGKAASRSQDKDKPFGPFNVQEVPDFLNYDLWLGPAPDAPYCDQRIGWNFRWWFEYSGGQVTDWGVHHTDIAFWALAAEDGQAVEASGTGKFMGTTREESLGLLSGKIAPKDMPLAWNVAHSFDVDISLSTGNTIKLVSGENALWIKGELGQIRVNRERLTGSPVDEIDADKKATEEINELMVKIYGSELPQGHMNNFFDCVRSGKQPVANVVEHVRAVNACHLANIALLTGRKVKFDPTTNSFPGDDEANKLVKRQARDGYAING